MERPFENLTDAELVALDWAHKCSTWPVSDAFRVPITEWGDHFEPASAESLAINKEIQLRWLREHDYAQT